VTTDPLDAVAAAADPSRVVDKYVCVARLGRGGSGDVWRAWDRDLKRWVALKFLRSGGPGDAERFLREARTTAQLSHPGLCAIHDVGESQGRHYIAMQLVEGRTLEEIGGADRRLIARAIRDAARALHHAHQKGIVHRDLKPTNIMVERVGVEGRTFVMDFGIARVSVEATLSATGYVVGTPAYMSPEQAAGRHDLGPASDVYGLGATLYAVLAGRPPFRADSPMAIMRCVAEDEPLPLTGVPVELETIIHKAMAKEAWRRYPTAAALADDLTRWLDGGPIAARPPSLAARAVRFVSRRRAAFVAGVALAVAVAAVAWGFSRGRPGPAVAPARDAQDLREALAMLEGGRQGLDRAAQYIAQRGATHEGMVERVDEALVHIQGALRLAPDLAAAHVQLARAWEMKGARDRAEAALREAVARDPRFGAARIQLAKLLLERAYVLVMGDTSMENRAGIPEAEALAQEASREIDAAEAGVGVIEDQVQRAVATAMLTYIRGDASSVRRIVTEAFDRFADGPGTEELHWLRAHASPRSQQPAFFDRAIELRPTFALAFWSRGFAHAGAGENAKAVEDFTECLRLRPGFAPARLNRGVVRHRMGDPDGALADIDEAVRLDPGLFAGYVTRGFLWSERGDWARAVADAEQAIRLRPQLPNGWLLRARTKLGSGDRAGAIADYEETLRRAPDDWGARDEIEEKVRRLRAGE